MNSGPKTRAVDSDRYMFFATRARLPSGYAIDTTSIALTYFASKLKFGNASYKTRNFRFHYAGFAMTEGGTAPQETVLPGNDVVIDSVSLVIGGIPYPGTFSGSAGTTITSGSKGAWCDFLTAPTLDAEADFFVVTKWHVASVGQKFIGGYRIQKHRGEKYWAASDSAGIDALIAADGTSTSAVDTFYNVLPGNQTNSQLIAYGPDFMVAKGDWDGRPVALCAVDSIGYGRNEVSATADVRGNFGWLTKWLDIAGGSTGRVPYFIIGDPGSAAARELGTSATLRWDILDDIKAFNNSKYPHTVVINGNIRNDNSSVASTWKSAVTTFISTLRTRLGASTKVIQITTPPTNSTTAGYSTQAAISISTAGTWQTNRNSVNSDIRTNNGFNHNGYIDLDVAWCDPTVTDKFRAATDIGTIGNLTNYVVGDGASVLATGTVNYPVKVGDAILAEFQTGTYGGRVVQSVDADNGNGTFNVTFTTNSATAFQTTSPLYWSVSTDGIHPSHGYIDNWIVPRIPQSDKSKLS